MGLRPGELLIDDETLQDPRVRDLTFAPVVGGERKGRGGVPRDFSEHPREMFDPPAQLPLIPRSEWSARIKEMEQQKSRLSDMILAAGIPSMDQDGVGYCWAHSTTGCVMFSRCAAGLPYVPLSAFAVAATIKKGADEGGWCGLSAQFARQKGIPSQALWPQQDRDYRKHDTPEVWASAALHKTQEEWVDLTRDVYDQELTFDQLMTCLLLRLPCPVDFNWWSHSVAGCDPVEVEANSFGIRIRNSWTDSYGDKGFAVLRGQKAVPDSCLCVRGTTAAAA